MSRTLLCRIFFGVFSYFSDWSPIMYRCVTDGPDVKATMMWLRIRNRLLISLRHWFFGIDDSDTQTDYVSVSWFMKEETLMTIFYVKIDANEWFHSFEKRILVYSMSTSFSWLVQISVLQFVLLDVILLALRERFVRLSATSLHTTRIKVSRSFYSDSVRSAFVEYVRDVRILFSEIVSNHFRHFCSLQGVSYWISIIRKDTETLRFLDVMSSSSALRTAIEVHQNSQKSTNKARRRHLSIVKRQSSKST